MPLTGNGVGGGADRPQKTGASRAAAGVSAY